MSESNDRNYAGYIPPVSFEELAKVEQDSQKEEDQQKNSSANGQPGIEVPWKKLIEEEAKYIKRLRENQRRGQASMGGDLVGKRGDHVGDGGDLVGDGGDLVGDEGDLVGKGRDLVGLALSGGGIRSATFSLGIVQALAAENLLKKVDYLSTVSGGGYMGSALNWLTSHQANKESARSKSFGVEKENFPFGTQDPAPEAPRKKQTETQSDTDRMLKYLRRHGFYLTPGGGLNLLSLAGVVLRGTLLNLAVWIPIFILLFLSAMWVSEQLVQRGFATGLGTGVEDTALLPSLLDAIEPPAECDGPGGVTGTAECETTESAAVFRDAQERLPQLFGFELLLSVAQALVLILLISIVGYSLLTRFRRGKERGVREKWYRSRRLAEKWVARLLAVLALAVVVGTLPVVSTALSGGLAAAGPLAMLTGMTVVIRYFAKASASSSGVPVGILVPLASALFLYGVFLVAYQVAWAIYPLAIGSWQVWAILVFVPALLGVVVNLNYISIHRFYRDRLMETFMPDINNALQNKTGAAEGADGATLHAVSDVNNPAGPYHIVNTNLVLANSDDETFRIRGGDNFILSPLYCGSNATGWAPSANFMGGKMTLATAVAISGAAANPNTGVGGEGLTRNRILSLVMSLLNLRLGYWACHPDPDNAPNRCPNHFSPGGYSFGNALHLRGFDEKRKFLQLSDGGHFENTGVYELIRRKVKLIIVCDGGGDPAFSFSDFQTTLQRVEDDFGARIRSIEGATPDEIVPVPVKGAVYPKDASFAKQGFMVGEITYADDSRGTLIYLKTTLIDGVSFRVKGYAAQHREFPDESTADQFFDEVQFEAYRELGYRIADQMLKTVIPSTRGTEKQATLKDLIGNCSIYGDITGTWEAAQA